MVMIDNPSNRSMMAVTLIGIAAALAVALGVSIGPEGVIAFLITMPVALLILWWSRAEPAFSDR